MSSIWLTMKVAFDHFSFFALRLPFRSISQLIDHINQSLYRSPSERTALLLRLLEQPWVAESIYLASPDLYSAWQIANSKGLDEALQKALWCYLIRSYGRATPYGLFAGVGLGKIDQNSRVVFGHNPWTTVSRPDCLIPMAISQVLDGDPSIRPLLHYRLNNSLYKAGNQYRFSELTGSRSKKKIVLSSLPWTPDLELLVDYVAGRGTASYNELTLIYGIEHQQAVMGYINQLIDDQFLISNLTLPVTGAGMTDYLLEQLDQINLNHSLYQQLIQATSLLASSPIQLSSLEGVNKLFGDLVRDEPVDRTDALVQTDLYFFPEHLELSSTTVRQIVTQFSRLLPLLVHRIPNHLNEFARRFKERFDRQKIDLLVALDAEVGIVFLQDNLTEFPFISDLFKATPAPYLKEDYLQPLRERLYSRCVLGKLYEVELTEADLTTLDSYGAPPPSWYLHGELFTQQQSQEKATSVGSGNSDSWRFAVNSTTWGSAAYFLGRFCQGHTPLKAQVEQLCAWEQAQYPSDILAELVHMPTAPTRAGNVVARPVLRAFEIPYLTPAGVADDHTISLSDIVVSVTDDESVLLSHKQTGQRIRPRHSNAHNSGFGDEVYQFLVAIQASETPVVAWSWGTLHHLPFLPRLAFKNLIISPAQWALQIDHLPPIQSVTADFLRVHYQLPRYVYLIEGDNKLLLDLDFEPTRQILVDELTKQNRILLKEWIGQSYQPWVVDGSNQYVSELIIPLKTCLPAQDASKPEPIQNSVSVPRTILPGQDWFYVKVYLNEAFADTFLVSVLKPLIEQAQKKRWASNAFFIRYTDPNYHLRIRCQTTPKHYGRLVNAWQKTFQKYIQAGLIERVQLDTYQRELERYHPELIDFCESIFAADSQCILNWLDQPKVATDEDRYRLALQSVDALLSDFALSMTQKVSVCRKLQQAFFAEHGGHKDLKQKLNQRYRDNHRLFLTYSALSTALLEERSSAIQPSVYQIQEFFSCTDQAPAYYALLSSLIHMSINRIFSAHQRKHELVIYHFLARHNESLQARLAT